MTVDVRIVVCGESLMDVFQQGATPTGLALSAVVGGSPLNVALGVARLGARSTFFGGVSGDFLGQRIQQCIDEEGIDRSCLRVCDAPTTLSLVGVDAQGVPSYRFYGQGAADRQLEAADLVRVPVDAAALHFGSYACVVEPIGSTLRALVEARRATTVIAYDPNVRLNVEPDLAVWRAQVDWMAQRAHLLKLSDEDFERLYPGGSIEAQAAAWLSRGVRVVMLTRGPRGARSWSAAGQCEAPAPSVSVLDTVGAGDTFQAATLVALAELGRLSVGGLGALTLEELSRVTGFAAQAAALTCTRRGPDLPRRADLPATV